MSQLMYATFSEMVELHISHTHTHTQKRYVYTLLMASSFYFLLFKHGLLTIWQPGGVVVQV